MSFDYYFDPAGLLTNKLSGSDITDDGDSCQMTGLYRFGRYLQFKKVKDKVAIDKEGFKFAQEVQILSVAPGVLVRHPTPSDPIWASISGNTSRDQERSIVMACGPMKQKKTILLLLWKLIKRGGFYQNSMVTSGPNTAPTILQTLFDWQQVPDFASPEHIGEYVRAAFLSRLWPVIILWPLLLITDMFALLGLLINFFYTWKQPDSADDDNDQMSYLLAKHSLPTPVSWLIWKLYIKYRPLCIGATLDMNGPQSACARKHRAETGSPPFYDLYKDFLK